MGRKEKEERYQFIEQMFDKLDNLPVESVVGRYVKLQSRGRHLMGLCPFHKDRTIGSFIVTPDRGIWKCFACGDEYGGNGIKFVSLYKGIGNYLEAAFETARENGLITFDEYETYSQKRYDQKFVTQMCQKHEAATKRAQPVQKRASITVRNNVYGLMKSLCTLNDRHTSQLVEERKLPEERIQCDYFSFPTQGKKRIIDAIKAKYPDYTDQVLMTVPGFYYDKKSGSLSFTSYRGIGILIRNANGLIEAIQIRKDSVKEGESRYTWFSSSFAVYKPEEYEGGCSCGSPKDVCYPEQKERQILCITEGRFKSEKLAAFGNTSISVQGVTSWHGIEDVIENICKKKPIEKIFVFFDADIWGKHELFLQSVKMVQALQKRFPALRFFYAVWQKELGKGIDDCIINGNIKQVSFLNAELTINTETQVYASLLKQFGITNIRELPDEKVEEFCEILQDSSECALLEI